MIEAAGSIGKRKFGGIFGREDIITTRRLSPQSQHKMEDLIQGYEIDDI